MPTFSFDIVSDYDKAEMNNVFQQTEREIANRYDFKGTPAAIEWLDDKTGFKLIGQNQWQIDALLDIIRKKLAAREQSSKLLDLTSDLQESNLKATKVVPFRQGLSQDNSKIITKALREQVPKVKAQIQGEEVRVTSSSKDELQNAMQVAKQVEVEAPLQFVNFR